MKREYRKLVQVKPILMYRGDLIELCDLFEAKADEEKKVEIEYRNSEESIKITDIDSPSSILDIPPTHDMSLAIRIWKEREIVSGISVSFNFNHVLYQLHSENEIWFLGTGSKLSKFFKAKRPWYSPIQRFSAILSPVVIILCFQHASGLVAGGENTEGIFWFAGTAILVVIAILIFCQKIFPYVWISLSDKKNRKFSYGKGTFIVSILGLVAAIVIGFFLPLLKI